MSTKVRKKYWQFLVSDNGTPIPGALIKVATNDSDISSSIYLPIYKTSGDNTVINQTKPDECIKTDSSGFFSFWVQSEMITGTSYDYNTDVKYNQLARIEWYSGISNGYVDDVYIATQNVGPQGPQGVVGPKGSQGEKSDITGPTGAQGAQSAIKVGQVTLSNNSSSQLTITNSGTPTNVTLDFNIPRGYQGSQGSQGRTGDTGAQGFQGFQGITSGMPIGSVVAWAKGVGSLSVVPDGWYECKGQTLEILAKNAAIAAVLGSYKLPDLRGEFIRGWINGRSDVPGQSPIRDPLSWENDTFKTHTHVFRAWGYGNGIGDSSPRVYSPVGGSDNTYSTGDIETRPRNIAMMYIIRAF